jgi:hypothetical protein
MVRVHVTVIVKVNGIEIANVDVNGKMKEKDGRIEILKGREGGGSKIQLIEIFSILGMSFA